MINDFIHRATFRDIRIFLKNDLAGTIANLIKVPHYENV